MLKELNTTESIVFCLFFAIAWHFISLALCVKISISHFDYNKPIYKIKKWENSGKFYQKYFKISRWKDRLPQHIAEDGFSKASVSGMSYEYFDTFIMETCRAGWCHMMNCCCFFALLLFSPNLVGVIFGILAIIVNIPFIMIQRYNRARLLKILSRMKKQSKVSSVALQEA